MKHADGPRNPALGVAHFETAALQIMGITFRVLQHTFTGGLSVTRRRKAE